MAFSRWNETQSDRLYFNTTKIKIKCHQNQYKYIPCATINSEHDLVICNIKFKMCIKKRTKSTRIQYDLDKLRNPVLAKEYSDKLKTEILQIIFNS